MSKMKEFATSALLLAVLFMFAYPVHELSHLFVANGLGYGAHWIVDQGIVVLHSTPTTFDSMVIGSAGGLGASVALLFLWRFWQGLRKHLPLAVFVFVISLELIYSLVEPLCCVGWVSMPAGVMGMRCFCLAYLAAVITAFVHRRRREALDRLELEEGSG